MLYNVVTGLKNIIYVIIFIIFEILKPQTAYIRVVLFKNARKVNLKIH